MTSLTGGNAAANDIRKLMEQIIAERDAKFAPKKEGGEAAPTGGMFDKPEVKANDGDVITDLLGYLEQKRTEALDSYQSKVMRRSSKPLPKPEDIDVSSFLSEAGLSPTSVADPMTIMSRQAPELSKSRFSQMSENLFMDTSKEPAKPLTSSVLAARETLPIEELTDDEYFLRTGKMREPISSAPTDTGSGLMSPNQASTADATTVSDIQSIIGTPVDGQFGPNSKKRALEYLKDKNVSVSEGLTDQELMKLVEGDSPLHILKATRAKYRPTAQMNNISLDFNSSEGATGTEVIIPDNASAEVRAAAENFNQMVVDFAAKHGYTDYKNRGVKTKSENKRGVSNTIHVEPFFQQDAAMEKIINENMEEFAKLYTASFGNLSARMVAPHGTTNKKGIVDKGANSTTFGNELAFGNRIIDILQAGN